MLSHKSGDILSILTLLSLVLVKEGKGTGVFEAIHLTCSSALHLRPVCRKVLDEDVAQ